MRLIYAKTLFDCDGRDAGAEMKANQPVLRSRRSPTRVEDRVPLHAVRYGEEYRAFHHTNGSSRRGFGRLTTADSAGQPRTIWKALSQ